MGIAGELKEKRSKLAVVGLGYVGLPLAVEFGRLVPVLGFDVNKKRIGDLKEGHDRTGEISKDALKSATLLNLTTDPAELKTAKIIILAVPTPITKDKQPDLNLLTEACKTVGKNLTRGAMVILESTVYPGVTEEVCVPLIEKFSRMKYGRDFKVGYSPERMNPGDSRHSVSNIVKVVSGSDEAATNEIASVYELIVKAGVFKAQSILTAEAAKVIENTQRDLNIALMNELAIIFNKMGLDTRHVLDAAGTKWNFVRMSPGLVGGHCIGVDPYYLTHKAEALGYHPEVILAGRRINDNMGKFVAEETVKRLIDAGHKVKGSKILILGITFKENVRDIRNSRVIDLAQSLKSYGAQVTISDPKADPKEVRDVCKIELTDYDPGLKVDAVIVAVNHETFRKKLSRESLGNHLTKGKGVLVDVKGMFDPKDFKDSGFSYWRL